MTVNKSLVKKIGVGNEMAHGTVRESIALADSAPTISNKNALVAVVGAKYEENVVNFLNSVAKLDLLDMTVDRIKTFGFPLAVAKKLFGAIQFALSIQKEDTNGFTVRSPEDAATLFTHLQFEKQEHFMLVGLNVKNQVLFSEVIFVGSLNASIVHPREVLQKLLAKNGCASFIVGHNHPSGNPSPSPEDIDVTERLYEAGKIVGMDLLDHIVVGDNSYVSLKEKGYF